MGFLELRNIYKEFAGTKAVEDFNLSAEQGEFISFLGPSGCGKTTTLRMIAGFELPTSGLITIGGKDLTFVSANKRKVGMVFQSYALFPNMTVFDNIGYGLKVTGKSKREIEPRVKEMLSLIYMDAYADRYPNQLSGGQQQRVALARALAFKPEVLLLDEPLSALDAKIRVELRQEIRRIQRQLGITTIYVTHDQEEALSLSDRVVVMSHGKIEQTGTPTEIYNRPATEFVASFVGQLNLIPVTLLNLAQNLVSINGQAVKASRIAEKFSQEKPRLAIRPEELNPGFIDGHNHLEGIIDSINYLGSIVRLRMTLDGSFMTIDMFNEQNLKIPTIGDPYVVNFPDSACWLI